MTYRLRESLADRHLRSAFECRSAEQTDWARRHAGSRLPLARPACSSSRRWRGRTSSPPRLNELAPEIGCRGLLVHAESTQARDFYQHLVPEFESSPTDDLHLLILLKDICRALRC